MPNWPVFQLNYQNGMRLRYDNPSEQYCMRLDTCPHWAPSTWTTRDRVDGWKEFETPKSIRSFKFGDYEDALLVQNLTEAAQTCNVAKARATFEGLEVNDTVANATSTIELSSAEGGLSSNWTNLLPVE
ncbi:hypothetical protein PHYSODRAFT_262452 [Phytophthora sojae]|uniref:Uncharacterized protein n=1 Tax=Phytophthora sojae (strain P6497) TaxID=1094619 RepID=G4ZI01_PHYSP|nr:hypothetical protein PHYSODRAFT_262452 [Phytophthora sojae]EGZ17644.1 hypothetical protein PHYSODRAFT_262452 [Phytophthora sojae]|eukprot:XP_009526702.1 hypothetical protein PHYSODRAFT_262452 [Phytophthora sojae]